MESNYFKWLRKRYNETKKHQCWLGCNWNLSIRNFEKNSGQRDVELNFEGLTFNTGDYIYADNDGILTKTKHNKIYFKPYLNLINFFNKRKMVIFAI